MFQVLRWPGSNGAAADRTSKHALSLQQLNAKARERALSRRSRAAVDGAPRPASEGGAVRSGAVNGDAVARSDQSGADEAQKAIPGDARKGNKKKRANREIEQCVENVKDGIEKLEAAGTLPSRNQAKKRSKIKTSLAPEPKPSTENCSLHNVNEPSLVPDVSGSLLPASVACDENGNGRHAVHEIFSEQADDRPTGRTIFKEKKKKRKAESDTATALETEVDVDEDRTGEMVNGAPSATVDSEPDAEFDQARIERDVEKIMGKPPSTSVAEAQRKTPPVLPWMRDPLDIGSYNALPLNRVPGLDIRLQDALKRTGVAALFPVQVAVWNETVGAGRCERDLCICSPTGSGKTLSYALPLVQKLSTRVIRRLRALIVLPTRDLASQVHAVFGTLAPAVGLKVGLAVGQTSIMAEAADLVKLPRKLVHSFGDTGQFDFAESGVDILVATPGRLMDHLRNTKEFTLQHLLYLVVDETDRLLRQSYQDWLSNVLRTVAITEVEGSSILRPGPISGLGESSGRCLQTIRHLGANRGVKGSVFPRLMKLVLSATLTRDPSKIAQLALYRPLYIAQSALDNRYQLPEQLQAMKLVCNSGEKPLYLVALLQQMSSQRSIVFTASVVATHRLFTFLNAFEGLPFKVVEYSSLQHQQARSKALSKFRDGEAQVLVASDAMTRGMDVEGVGNVVNYDMPVYAKTYVHRVGRTARAGRAGCSYTLLRREELRHFKSLLKKADNSLCKDFRIPPAAVEQLHDRYITALDRLKQITLEESMPARAFSTKESKTRKLPGEEDASGADELFM